MHYVSLLCFPFLLVACFGGNNNNTDNSLSDNAQLANLQLNVSVLDQAFQPDQLMYTANVANATATITVTPTTNDANATMTVNGVAVTSGSASGVITLNVGDNTISVVVTAEDGTTSQIYMVAVTRPSNDASLSGLTLSVTSLDQIFQSNLYSYTATVGYLATSISVMPTSSDAKFLYSR